MRDRNSNVDDRPGTRTDHLANDTTAAPDRTDVVGQQRELFGGIKFGSCFFGWLTASGTAVLRARRIGHRHRGRARAEPKRWGGLDIPRSNPVGRIRLADRGSPAIIFVSYLAGG